jgi:hypothetical protein
MKKIIITLPATSLYQIEAIGLALFAGRMKELVSEQFFIKSLDVSFDICLN